MFPIPEMLKIDVAAVVEGLVLASCQSDSKPRRTARGATAAEAVSRAVGAVWNKQDDADKIERALREIDPNSTGVLHAKVGVMSGRMVLL